MESEKKKNKEVWVRCSGGWGRTVTVSQSLEKQEVMIRLHRKNEEGRREVWERERM